MVLLSSTSVHSDSELMRGTVCYRIFSINHKIGKILIRIKVTVVCPNERVAIIDVVNQIDGPIDPGIECH